MTGTHFTIGCGLAATMLVGVALRAALIADRLTDDGYMQAFLVIG
jgi:hypothetical protein